jgi:hypothetical protein
MATKAVTVKKVTVFQQANGYWRWRVLGYSNARLANAAKSYSNYGDAVSNLLGVIDPVKRKIPVTVTKKDGSKTAFAA